MKILHVIDSGGLYGAEIMLLTLCEELQKLGHQPVIASIGCRDVTDKPLEGEARKRGILVEPFRFRNGPNPFGAWKLLSYAKSNRFDIIHSHGYKGNVLLGFIPRKVRKIPMLCTVHGWTSTRFLSLLKLYEWADSLSHRYLDAVVLVHGAMLTHRNFSGRVHSNIVIINNGIPNNKYDNTNSTLEGYSSIYEDVVRFCSQRKTVGAIGRLTPEKGFIHLIDAFNLVVADSYDANLIIIGEGPERNRLENMIEMNDIGNRVMLAGYIPNASNYLKYLDILVIPSLTEGLPISLLEAMREKVPVISTDVGGIKDVLGDGEAGIIVKPCDTNGLKQAMCRLIYDRALAEVLTERAEGLLYQNYTSTVMVKKYMHLYEDIIESSEGNHSL